jgi:hypothetical protein
MVCRPPDPVMAPMTLEAYDAQKLDQLSLRLLDVIARLRRVAQISRENGLEKIDLHDHKPREWIARLEKWAQQSSDRVEAAVQRRKALG